MARDLIPPPSPAGRPEPDAPRFIELPPEPTEDRAAAATADEAPAGPSPYRNRFGFVLGGLAGVLLAAVVVLAVVVTTGGDPSKAGLAKNWSTWRPPDRDATSGAQEIAEHVGAEYHLADGSQLVSVTGGPLQIQNVPLEIALRPPDGSIQLLNGKGVLYTLNGLGRNGSIVSGKPTTERHRLLRREALELALYSFRYLNNVDMVVALLPPQPPKNGDPTPADPTQTSLQALFYRPGDLRPQLEVPLRFTIPPATPNPDTIPPPEARRIDALTRSNLFLASFQQAQDTKAYLVLNRIP